MKETEILRGLSKAKERISMYAKGTAMVKPKMYADGTAMVAPVSDRLATLRQANPVIHQNAFAQHAQNHADFIASPPQQVAAATPTPAKAPNALMDPIRKMIGPSLKDAIMERAMGNYATGTAELAGPGTSTSDSIPANLSVGEAVLPAKTVAKVGAQNIARLIESTNGKPPKGPVQSVNSGRIGAPGQLGTPDPMTVGTISGGMNYSRNKFALGTAFVDDPLANAAQNRVNAPTSAAAPAAPPTPVVSAPAGASPTMAPEIAIPPASAPVRPGIGGVYDSTKSALSGGLNKAKSFISGAPKVAAVAPEAASSALLPAGAGFARIGATLKGAGSLLSKGVSSGLAPAAVIASNVNSYNTSTPEFQARTGIDNELGARALGVMGDVGNAVTGGLAGKLGNYFAGNTGNSQSAAPEVDHPLVKPPAAATPDAGTIPAAAAAAPVETPAAPVETPAALKGSNGDLANIRQQIADTTINADDTAEERVLKNERYHTLQAQADVGKSEAAAQGNIYGADKQSETAKFGDLTQLQGNRMANNVAYQKLGNDLHNTKVQQNSDTFQNLFPDVDSKGNSVKGGPNHAAAMDKLVGTVGKYGLDIGDLKPEDINQFKDLYDVSKSVDDFNNSTKGQLFNALLQSRAATSRDVTRYGATAEHPGAFINDTTRGVGGRVTNATTYKKGNFFGPPNQDLIDLTAKRLNGIK